MQFKKMSQKAWYHLADQPHVRSALVGRHRKNRPKVGGVATYPLSSLSWTKKNTNGVWTLTKYSFASKVEQPLYSRSCYLFMEMIAQKKIILLHLYFWSKDWKYWILEMTQRPARFKLLRIVCTLRMINDHFTLRIISQMIISQHHVCLDHAADHEFCRELWKQYIWI